MSNDEKHMISEAGLDVLEKLRRFETAPPSKVFRERFGDDVIEGLIACGYVRERMAGGPNTGYAPYLQLIER